MAAPHSLLRAELYLKGLVHTTARVVSIIRLSVCFVLGFAAMSLPSLGQSSAWSLLKNGDIVLFRHAHAPGGGDPPDFMLDHCASQRNLDDAGRAQAKQIGEQFRARKVKVGAIWTSQWCRTRDTAELAFPGRRKDEPAFNSFFQNRDSEPAQTARAKALLSAWQGPGVLVVVTHQVNITALTGIFPASGEGVVVRNFGMTLTVKGRLGTTLTTK